MLIARLTKIIGGGTKTTLTEWSSWETVIRFSEHMSRRDDVIKIEIENYINDPEGYAIYRNGVLTDGYIS